MSLFREWERIAEAAARLDRPWVRKGGGSNASRDDQGSAASPPVVTATAGGGQDARKGHQGGQQGASGSPPLPRSLPALLKRGIAAYRRSGEWQAVVTWRMGTNAERAAFQRWHHDTHEADGMLSDLEPEARFLAAVREVAARTGMAIRSYSSDLTTAWRVVEHLRAQGWTVALYDDGPPLVL